MLIADKKHFCRHFGTEAKCIEAFARWRWPDGFRCSKCGHDKCHVLTHRGLRQCRLCLRQNSVTSGTLLHNSKLPLSTWFYGLYLLEWHGGGRGVSTFELAAWLDISYNAAYRMRNKLDTLMNDPDRPLRLARMIQPNVMVHAVVPFPAPAVPSADE